MNLNSLKLLVIDDVENVWFSNRRARLRKQTGSNSSPSIASYSSLPMPQLPCPYPAGEIPLPQHHPQHPDAWHHQKYANYTNQLMAQSQHLNQAFQNAAFPSTSGSTFSHLVPSSNGTHSQLLDPGITRNDYARYPGADIYGKPVSYLPKETDEDKVPSDEAIEPREDTYVKSPADDYAKALPESDYPKVPADYSKVSVDPSASSNWSPSHNSLNMSLAGISSEYKYMNDPYTFPNVADPLAHHNYPNPPNASNKYWI